MKKLLSILLLLPLLPELARSQTCSDLGITRPLINIQLTDSAEHNSGNHYVSTGVQAPGGPPADPGAVTGKCTYSSGGGANCDTSCSVAITGSTSNGI